MNIIYKTLSALVTASFVSCSEPTPTRTEQIPSPTPESLALKNDDCGVGKLHEALYETIKNYNGFEGLNVISPMTIEAHIPIAIRHVPLHRYKDYTIGHDRYKGMYVHDTDGRAQLLYFKEGYVPNGDEMACDLAEKLLKVAELAKVKVQ